MGDGWVDDGLPSSSIVFQHNPGNIGAGFGSAPEATGAPDAQEALGPVVGATGKRARLERVMLSRNSLGTQRRTQSMR